MTASPPPGPISAHVARLRSAPDDPLVIARLASGWAVLNADAPDALRGACVLLPDPVVPSINDLEADARATFTADLLRLGDALLAVTDTERINYLILCNQAPELHGHVVPRFAAEDPARRRLGPFQAYDFGAGPPIDGTGSERPLIESLRAALA